MNDKLNFDELSLLAHKIRNGEVVVKCVIPEAIDKTTPEKIKNLFSEIEPTPKLHTTDTSFPPFQIIRDIIELRESNVKKPRSRDNWKYGEIQKYSISLFRHFMSFVEDPNSIDKSGFPHYKHMASDMAYICELMNSEQK